MYYDPATTGDVIFIRINFTQGKEWGAYSSVLNPFYLSLHINPAALPYNRAGGGDSQVIF
jgi:hypothetical protein